MKYNPVSKLDLYVGRISSALAGIQDIIEKVVCMQDKTAPVKKDKKAPAKKSKSKK